MDLEKRFRVPAKGFDLGACDPGDKAGLKKNEAKKLRAADLERLAGLQERLYAEGRRSLLVVLQAMDAAGKDGTIAHVMSGLNPQGVGVTSFKQPSPAELGHDFLWRAQLALPARGRIGVFNRSHYEEVLVVRVHPQYLAGQGIDPKRGRGKDLWRGRFEDIRTWERHLARGGTRVVKFFLDVSRAEQRKRFLARADEAQKNWKFSAATSPSASTGMPTARPTPTCCATRAPPTRPGTSCPPTTSGSRGRSSRRSSPGTSRRWTRATPSQPLRIARRWTPPSRSCVPRPRRSHTMSKGPRTPRQRRVIAILLPISLALVAVAQRDLHRRPEAQVRGDKRLWRALCLNAVGAVAYLSWGRQADAAGGRD